jgi:hypothetical protein
MSEPPRDRTPGAAKPPPEKENTFFIFMKWMLYLLAGTVVLAFLAFGTCLLMLRH